MKTKTKTKDLSIIPCSKARTAYGLLEDVKQAIKDDPKRYDQTQWVSTIHEKFLKGRDEDGDITFVNAELRPWILDDMPKCGTIGCVAGWVYSMKAPIGEKKAVSEFAQKILGLSDAQASELFDGDAADHPEDRKLWDEDADCSYDPADAQTKEHAENGIAHITRFQKKYEAQLKAKKV